MRTHLSRFRSDQRGAVAVLAAGAMIAVLGFAALGVDYGKLTVDRRRAQSVADLAALSAAADLARAGPAALATVERNGLMLDGPLRVEVGRYVPDGSRQVEQRFVAGLQSGANAVRVTLQTRSDLYFARAISGQKDMLIRTTATAATSAFASFAIGSRLLALDNGLINGLLGGLLGTTVNLTVMDYQALVDARIDLFRFLPLLADRANISAASYDQLLVANVRLVDVVGAMATAALTPEGGSTAASRALSQVLQSLGGSHQILPLSSLMSVGPYGAMPVGTVPTAGVSASALDLVTAAAQIAGGARQVEADLGVNLPGIAGASVALTIGERPVGTSWITIGREGASVHTAQTRLLVRIRLLGAGAIAAVNLPIYVELASATARLSSLTCTFPDTRWSSMSLAVTPAVVDAWIGTVTSAQMVNFSTPPQAAKARLVDTPLLRVLGRAHATVTNMAPRSVAFSLSDVERQTKKTVGTYDFTRSLLTRLVDDLDLDVDLLGLGLGLPGPVKATVTGIISTATPSIDKLLSSILSTLGIGLGEADVWGLGLRCDGAVLVH